uniref:Uncharacterized protein n=1 Tax=Panagrolaimus sp. ES5 TaxID=591445 RepID=A0AC34G9L0_9BILA
MAKRRAATMEDLEEHYSKFMKSTGERMIPSWKVIQPYLKSAFKEKLLNKGTVEKQEGNVKPAQHVLYHPKMKIIGQVHAGVKRIHLPSKSKSPQVWFDEYKHFFTKKSVITFIIPPEWETESFYDMLQDMISLVLNIKVFVPKDRVDAKIAMDKINLSLIDAEILPDTVENIVKNIQTFIDETDKAVKANPSAALLDSGDEMDKVVQVSGAGKTTKQQEKQHKNRPSKPHHQEETTSKDRPQQNASKQKDTVTSKSYNLRGPSTTKSTSSKTTTEAKPRSRHTSTR